MNEYIDASVFLGMHSRDEQIRVACKNYFVERLDDEVGISLEQVGKCDDVIWQYSREAQDAYYPFMDNLHTVMDIKRVPYDERDIQEAIFHPYLLGSDIDFSDKLTLGMVLARRAVLYTVNHQLLNLKPRRLTDRLGGKIRVEADVSNSVQTPQAGKEIKFPEELEKLYQQSLVVRM
ncbi:MAG: DUF6190 family protein [Nanoarchaeota archaeon]